MPTPRFHLCEQGWQLYMVWSALCDTKAPRPERASAMKIYYDHRNDCVECTKPQEIVDWAIHHVQGEKDAEKQD